MNALDSAIHEQEIAKRGRALNARDKAIDAQEDVISFDVLRDRIDELVELHAAVSRARTEYGEAIKETAEACGLVPAVLRKYIAAKAADDATEHKRSADQLVLLFDELGA